MAHPHRIRIVEELRRAELDVNTLQAILEISHSRVSQHLSVLRLNHVVLERRQGRHVFYRLKNLQLAHWLNAGKELLDYTLDQDRAAVEAPRSLWPDPQLGT